MAYEASVAKRICKHLPDSIIKKMFGGLSFMIQGNMALGLMRNELMIRVASKQYQDMLGRPCVKVMDWSGRPMKGFIVVIEEDYADDADLLIWLQRGLDYALSLPAK
ncbi:MAG: TfoX/Sxy family protein [Deinococcota bacterium]